MIIQSQTIIANLFKITELFESEIKDFLNSFDNDELLSFSDNDEKRKKLISSYNKFSLKIKQRIDGYETNVSELSLLICKSDELCDSELTKKLSTEFDRYSVLFRSVKKFITNCESMLLKKDSTIKQSTIMLYARELLLAVTSYKNNF